MRNKTFCIIICLIFLIVFNLLYFLIGGTEQTTVNWLSYGFINGAYLWLLATPVFSSRLSGMTVLSGTLYLTASFYFYIELITGLVIMWIQPESFAWPLAIQSTIMGIFIIVQCMNVVSNSNTEESIIRQREESYNLRSLASQLKPYLSSISSGTENRRLVERCVETLNLIPIQSFPEIASIEENLKDSVNALCDAISSQNSDNIKRMALSVQQTLTRRSEMIKMIRNNR